MAHANAGEHGATGSGVLRVGVVLQVQKVGWGFLPISGIAMEVHALGLSYETHFFGKPNREGATFGRDGGIAFGFDGQFGQREV